MLSHGLNFGLPPTYLCNEEIFAEFESLCAQLLHHRRISVEQRTALKARLADFVHLYYDSTIDSRDFTMHKECFRATAGYERMMVSFSPNLTKAPALSF